MRQDGRITACFVAQACLFATPWTVAQGPSLVPGDSPVKSTGVRCHALLQGIFPTQGLNLGLPHCRQILYRLSHQGSLRILEWVAHPFSRGTSQPRNQARSPALQADSLPAKLPGKNNNRRLLKIFPLLTCHILI